MKIKILIISLLLILTIGAVWAGDDITSDELTVSADASICIVNESNEILTENHSATFTDLSELIKNTQENDTLELDEDYVNEGEISKEGICISKAMTIDGKGHTLNANKVSRIFDIHSSDVILKNIVFKNGQYLYPEKDYYSWDEGGAIYFNYDVKNCTINNCSFIDCVSESGTIHFSYESCDNIINNCSFINCLAKYRGSAVSSNGDNNYINNTSFIKCSKNGESVISYDDCSKCIVNNSRFIDSKGIGIEYLYCSNCFTNNCTFINCRNSAIYFSRGYSISDGGYGYYKGCYNCTVNKCSFTNCYSGDDGGAIIFYDSNENGIIENCIFTNCQAKNGGAIYFYDYYESKWCSYFSFEKAIIRNCSFINCKANYGGSVYVGDDSYYAKVIGCSFINSNAIVGGAIYWSGKNGRIENSNFTSSHAVNGGAVYSDKNINLKIIETDFKNNIADKYGSAVYGASVSKCTFSKNTKPEIYSKYSPAISAANTKITYTEIYSIKVYKNTKVSAKYTKIILKLNGKSFKTVYTKDNGIAKFKIDQKPGRYKLSITSLGKTVTKTLTVKHIVILKAVKVKKSAKKITLEAALAKVNGKYLKNKQITFKFNGKTFPAKTNSKGVAKVTVPQSVLSKLKVGKKITYQATYLKDIVKKTVKVRK